MKKIISLAVRLRRVKLFLTAVDGVLVPERRLVAGFAVFDHPKPATDRRSVFVGRDNRSKERQRRSILQPRVGAQRLPWVGDRKSINPEGVASRRRTRIQPLQGCVHFPSKTQGSPLRSQPWAEFSNAVGVPRNDAPRSILRVECSLLDVSASTHHAHA